MRISTIKVIAVWLILSLCGAMANASAVTYVYTDAQGTPLAKADANGNITATFDYQPYGVQALGVAHNDIGYTGHVNDEESGFVYMQQRYYDPESARLLSVDQVNVYSNPIANFNRYWYANNNPYKFIDPDGRQTLPPSTYQVDWADPRTREAFSEVASTVADFTPGISDVKAVNEAIHEPTVGNVVAAGVGFIPIAGDLLGKGIKNADHLIEAAGKLDRLKGGVRQGRVQGDARSIFQKITSGGKEGSGGRVTMQDGTVIGYHPSKTTGESTIDINKNGKIYKIRVEPPPPPPPPPKR